MAVFAQDTFVSYSLTGISKSTEPLLLNFTKVQKIVLTFIVAPTVSETVFIDNCAVSLDNTLGVTPLAFTYVLDQIVGVDGREENHSFTTLVGNAVQLIVQTSKLVDL